MTDSVALAIGSGGAFLDVSSFIRGTEGVSYSWGQTDEFQDANPGVFTFTLENQDGRFLPDSTAVYRTALTEGTAACWSHNGRLVEGVVTGFSFGSDEENWGRLTVTCGDALTFPNRRTVSDLAADIGAQAAGYYWRCSDATSALVPNTVKPFIDAIGYDMVCTVGTMAAGTSMGTVTSDTGVTVTPSPTGVGGLGGNGVLTPNGSSNVREFDALGGTQFTLATFVQLVDATSSVYFAPVDTWTSGTWHYWVGLTGSHLLLRGYTSGSPATIASAAVALAPGQTHYLAVTFSLNAAGVVVQAFVDGALELSGTLAMTTAVPSELDCESFAIYVGNEPNAASSPGSGVSLQHIYLGIDVPAELDAGVTTWAARFLALCSLIPQITVGTIDPAISPAPIGASNMQNETVWQGFLDLVRTEQGRVYPVTTGSLTAPVTVVNVRSRSRPATVTSTFDAAADMSGPPAFARGTTNIFGTVIAAGPADTEQYSLQAAIAKAGNSSQQDTVLMQDANDLQAYAQDRMMRGMNPNLRVTNLTVDGLTGSSGVDASVLALTPGDRLSVTGLPPTQLGVSSWDGWLIGGAEQHAMGVNQFTLYVEPVLPNAGAKVGTALAAAEIYQDDGGPVWTGVELQSSILATDTTATVVLQGTYKTPLTTAVPFNATIYYPNRPTVPGENVVITAVSGTGPQTITMTRGSSPSAWDFTACLNVNPVPTFAF